MRITLKSMVLVAVVFMLMVATAGAEQVVNRVVAVVDDDVITAIDLDKAIKQVRAQMERMEAAQRGGGLPPGQIRRIALERLIDDKIFGREVKRLGLKVSDRELDNYINRIKRANNVGDADFLASLSHQGLTPQEYRENLRKDILKQRLINRAVKGAVVISDTEVEEYYKKNKGQYENLDEVMIRAIFFLVDQKAGLHGHNAARQKAENVLNDIKKGKDFAKMAQKYSQGPGADRGGKLGPVKASDLLPAMRQALAELKTGQMSEVLQIPQGYVIMQLIERSGDKGMAKEQVKEQIRQKLEQKATEKRFREWMKDLRSQAYIKIID